MKMETIKEYNSDSLDVDGRIKSTADKTKTDEKSQGNCYW